MFTAADDGEAEQRCGRRATSLRKLSKNFRQQSSENNRGEVWCVRGLLTKSDVACWFYSAERYLRNALRVQVAIDGVILKEVHAATQKVARLISKSRAQAVARAGPLWLCLFRLNGKFHHRPAPWNHLLPSVCSSTSLLPLTAKCIEIAESTRCSFGLVSARTTKSLERSVYQAGYRVRAGHVFLASRTLL